MMLRTTSSITKNKQSLKSFIIVVAHPCVCGMLDLGVSSHTLLASFSRVHAHMDLDLHVVGTAFVDVGAVIAEEPDYILYLVWSLMASGIYHHRNCSALTSEVGAA
jgi:hypothetical protein